MYKLVHPKAGTIPLKQQPLATLAPRKALVRAEATSLTHLRRMNSKSGPAGPGSRFRTFQQVILGSWALGKWSRRGKARRKEGLCKVWGIGPGHRVVTEYECPQTIEWHHTLVNYFFAEGSHQSKGHGNRRLYPHTSPLRSNRTAPSEILTEKWTRTVGKAG